MCNIIDRLLGDEWDDLIICMPPGSAKALALDTPVPTPSGWTRIGDLRPGDTVFDENGTPCSVTWRSPVFRNRPVYSVTTDCGDEIIADHDHEWLVRLCGKKRKELKGVDRWGKPNDHYKQILKDRSPGFKIKETHQLCKKRSKRPMIQRAAALELPDTFLPIDPYLLGVWLGDGTSGSMSITSGDEDREWMREELARLGYTTSDRKQTYLFGILDVRYLFVKMGLVHNPAENNFGRKHIPEVYLRGSYRQRLSLLQGLIDTDGTVCKSRGCTTFTNTNLELSLQLRELVRTLGVKAGWSEGRAMLDGVDHGPYYNVSFYLKDSARLPRKAILTRNQYRTPNTYIDVVPVGFADTVCIEVDSPSHLFLCGKSMTPTHNSFYTSIALPAYFIGKNPTKTVLTASHGFDLAEKWGKRVRNIVASDKYHLATGVKLSSDSRAAAQWTTTKGGEFFGVGCGGGVLGRRGDLVVIDDPISGWEMAQSATQLTKLHQWYETDLLSRLKPHGKIVLICQRLARNDLAGYIMDRNAASATRRLKTLILPMECVDEDNDPLGRSIGDRLWPEWYTPEMVTDFKRDDFIWRTMYQQEPPADDGAWVNTDDIQFRPTPQITPGTPIYGASDLALSVNSGDYTVHALVAIDSEGDWDIFHCQRKRCDPDESSADLVNLCATYTPNEWLIDDDNASKVFMPLVATKARQLGVPVPWKPLPIRGQDKETRAAALRGQFKRRKIYMPADAPFARWLVPELIKFPNAEGQGVDDGVDTLSLLGRRLSAISSKYTPPPPKKLPTMSEMTLEGLWDTAPKQSRNRRI
jgi:predicted phage terminase large subunit-like protein